MPLTRVKPFDIIRFPISSHGKLKQRFVEYALTEIKAINKLIVQYNSLTSFDSVPDKINLLCEINDLRKKLEDNYPQALTLSAFKKQIQTSLFDGLKTEFRIHGVNSMHDKVLSAARTSQSSDIPVVDIDPFSKWIADMKPATAAELLSCLSTIPFDRQAILSKFSSQNDRDILTRYAIELLGQRGGNSRNFKVTDHENPGAPPRILKIDHRLGCARSIDTHLRDSEAKQAFTPIEVSRTLTCNVGTKKQTRTLLITTLCEQGDLIDYASRPSVATDQGRLNSAKNFYTQMGKILIGIQESGCFFPDMKNTNWLIDGEDVLRIADTKSFLFADGAEYSFHQPSNQWLDFEGMTTTPSFNSPELDIRNLSSQKPFSIDSVHSFILGKNIYQYLTGCHNSYLADRNDSSQYDFSKPIFQTPEGRAFRLLICEMIQPNPAKRISLHKAVDALCALSVKSDKLIKDIEQPSTKATCSNIKQRLESIKQQKEPSEIDDTKTIKPQ